MQQLKQNKYDESKTAVIGRRKYSHGYMANEGKKQIYKTVNGMKY